MFITLSRKFYSILSIVLIAFLSIGLTACGKTEPPTPMKAVKQFESDEVRDKHTAYMRKNHMDALQHKRDKTMHEGIRGERDSLKACISCHVPEKHNGKVLRHTDSEHFCATCHIYVAAEPDCFQCHVDHPVSAENDMSEAPNDSNHMKVASNTIAKTDSVTTNTVVNTGESSRE